MKYTSEIEIDLPLVETLTLYTNYENRKHWMKGLEKIEYLQGTPDAEGSKTRLLFDFGNRKMDMVETVNYNRLPAELSTSYTTKGVTNNQITRFVEPGPNRTKYISQNEFKFKGILKLMGLLMSKAFKKQTMVYLNDFKTFAEAAAKDK